MENIMSSNYFPHQNHPAEVPGESFDLSVLADFDDWSTFNFPSERNIKPHSVPAFPKPDPDGFVLPEFEANLPPNFWYPPVPPHSVMASPYPSGQQLQYSQPPTPAAECQVSSTISPITSPYSPQSDFSDEPSPFGAAPGQDLVNIGDINIKGLTEEQLVSLTARDLNRICRDMPEDVIKQLKKRRRTLKNRGYAYNSRVRRVSQKNLLEDERDTLKQQLTQMEERIKFLERELDQWKRRAGAIEKANM